MIHLPILRWGKPYRSLDVDTVVHFDTGEPIAALRDLQEPASDSFMGNLHRRIQRRLLAADIGRLTWTGVIEVVVEFFNLIFGLVGVRKE